MNHQGKMAFPVAAHVTEIALQHIKCILCWYVRFPFQRQMEISFKFLGAGKS